MAGSTHNMVLGSLDHQFLRLGLGHVGDPDPDPYRWVSTDITLRMGGFEGAFQATLLVGDLVDLLEGLQRVHTTLAGVVRFDTLEGQVMFVLTVTSVGHVVVQGEVRDKAGTGNTLRFTLELDQTHLPPVIRDLESFLESIT